MAKGVLGNDPFKRAAAPRPTADKSETDAPPPAKTKKGPAKPRNRKTAAVRGPRPHPDSPSVVAELSQGAPVAHAHSPEWANASAPGSTAHGGSPHLISMDPSGIVDHPNSPELVAIIEGVTPHGDSPILLAGTTERAAPHPSSPDLIAANSTKAEAHPNSPELVQVLDGQPAPHRHSPQGMEVRDGPVGHPNSPDLLEVHPPGGATEQREPARPPEPHEASGTMALARQVARAALSSPALDLLRSGASGLMRTLKVGLGLSSSASLDTYGGDAELATSLGPIADFFFDYYWRVSVQNAERVPSGPVIVVANHSGALPYDGPVLHHGLSRERPDLNPSRWLVEDQIFHAPFLGTVMNRIGAVRANVDNALRLLRENRPILVFPEGIHGLSKPFAERYQLKRFGRGGYVKLALRAKAPIVPAAIVGAEEAAPLLGKLPGRFLGLPYVPVTPLGPLPLPSRWTIRFGEPLDLGSYSAETAEDLAEVQRLNDTIRGSIQGMLTAILRERPSVF